MATIERAVPQNIEAEEAVLGSLLIDPDAIIKEWLHPHLGIQSYQLRRLCKALGLTGDAGKAAANSTVKRSARAVVISGPPVASSCLPPPSAWGHSPTYPLLVRTVSERPGEAS